MAGLNCFIGSEVITCGRGGASLKTVPAGTSSVSVMVLVVSWVKFLVVLLSDLVFGRFVGPINAGTSVNCCAR